MNEDMEIYKALDNIESETADLRLYVEELVDRNTELSTENVELIAQINDRKDEINSLGTELQATEDALSKALARIHVLEVQLDLRQEEATKGEGRKLDL